MSATHNPGSRLHRTQGRTGGLSLSRVAFVPAVVIARSRVLTAAIVVAISAGIGLRAWALGSFLGTPDADEAMWTLMARHIRHGEFPVYFWGQSYGGTIEMYLA